MQSDYKPPIRGLSKLAARILLSILDGLPEKIEDPEVRLMASGLITGGQGAVQVLSDMNPNDADQLRGVLRDLIEQGEFREGSQGELLQQINRIGNDDARLALQILLDRVYNFASILMDTDQDNGAQATAELRDLLQSPDGATFVTSVVKIMLPGSLGAGIAFIILEALIELVGDDDGDTGAGGAKVRDLIRLRDKEAQRLTVFESEKTA